HEPVSTQGDRLIQAEISDYEVRRELERSGKHAGIERLERLGTGLGYLPLSTAMMRIAASLWASHVKQRIPNSPGCSLDGDVILAAQAQAALLRRGASRNNRCSNHERQSHLERHVDARFGCDIPSRCDQRRAQGPNSEEGGLM
ncbi:MAG: hypothetical protein IPF88_14225, partial [Candidatus Microthrix sp.]